MFGGVALVLHLHDGNWRQRLEVFFPFDEVELRIERFAASIPKHQHVARPLPQAAQSECEVTVIIEGTKKSFLLEKEKENIIEAGLRNGVELPYSCRGGVCST